jgi:hypothetical protein
VGVAMEILVRSAAPEQVTKIRIAEIAGFVTGGLGVTGGILALTIPSGRKKAAALPPPSITVGLGAGSIHVGGSF